MGRQGGWPIHRPGHHRNRVDLADSLKRYLLITRRRIPLDRSEDYERLWRNVRHEAALNRGRAWIFQATGSSDRFIEFVEWQSDEDHLLIDQPDMANALAALNAAFTTEDTETWIEAKI